MKKRALIMVIALAGCQANINEQQGKIDIDKVLLSCGTFNKAEYLHVNKDSFSSKLIWYAEEIDSQKKLSSMKLNYMLSFADSSKHDFYIKENSKCYMSFMNPIKKDVMHSFDNMKSISKSKEETEALENAVSSWVAYVDVHGIPPAYMKADLSRSLSDYRLK